ncbi:MAG: hypothetical protein AAGE05_11100 [Pseudomonadota bacterium]
MTGLARIPEQVVGGLVAFVQDPLILADGYDAAFRNERFVQGAVQTGRQLRSDIGSGDPARIEGAFDRISNFTGNTALAVGTGGRTAAVRGGARANSFEGISTRAIREQSLVEIDPRTVSFSQRTPRAQGSTVIPIANSMREFGFIVDPNKIIDIVRMPDGRLTTLDNTRVLAADQAGINIFARVSNFDDPLPGDRVFRSRFADRGGNVPETYGQAVTNRIDRQGAIFRNRYPNGSPFISTGNRYGE